jgi:AcrR family transcriptional regulator
VNKRVERGRSTRGQLVAIATRLFGERGYEGASIEAVLRESGLSRGALYHHFADKKALFEAVLEAVEADAARRTMEAAAGLADPAEALRAGCQAWVRIAGEPEVRRIVLIDAPGVVGWARWRELDEEYGFGALKAGLVAIAAAGRLDADLVDLFAHMILAALNEIALVVAQSPDPAEATRRGQSAVDQLLAKFLG